MNRSAIALTALIGLSAWASAETPPPASPPSVVRYTATVLNADPKLQILSPGTGEVPLTLRGDGRGFFTLPVFQYLGDTWTYPTDPAHGDMYGFTHDTTVRFALSIPGTGWSDTVTVTGHTSYYDVYRSAPSEGFGWRQFDRVETMEFVGSPNGPHVLVRDGGLSYHTRHDHKTGVHDIDVHNVRLNETPEPATLALAGIGLTGLVGVRLRRRAK